MTTGMPELGSKISLISKADIRYEGRLFTVDPQECTIALASVRSFGTEDRETQYPVPAQNQVYDYILFRGSDIKDIRVVNSVTHAQPLNDPAIMQLSVPPTMAGQQFQTHPVLGHMGAQLGQFGGAYGAIGPMGAMGAAMAPGLTMQAPPGTLRGSNSKPSELLIAGQDTTPSVLSSPPVVEAPRPSDHASVLDLIGGGTRSTTPASVASRKSPTNDQGVQAGGSKADKKVVKPIQPPGQRGQQRNKSRERRDSSRSKGDSQDHRPPQQQNQNQHVNRQPNRSHQNQAQNHVQGGGYHQNQGGYQGGHQGGYQGNHQGGGYQGHQGGYQGNHPGGYQGNQQGGYQGNQQQRGGWVNRGPIRPRGRPRGSFKPNQGQPHGSKKNTLKFDNDYDFEQANTEFEVMMNEISKVKIDDAAVASKPEVNGDVDKKDDSGNETGAGEPEQEEDHEVFYDKNKSFFDKISCEAVERAKGKCQRTDWRVERKLNSETFGVSATRRGGYYSYRGRGGFRGMGYRGGYRGAYRYPQRRDPNQQQPQQQSTTQSQQQQQVRQ